VILLEIVRGAWESVRETWPTSESDAGPFLAGFCWAFCLHWVVLFAVTYAHCRASGTC
jgi:hypothetical protein